jgi:hypothetical protein
MTNNTGHNLNRRKRDIYDKAEQGNARPGS